MPHFRARGEKDAASCTGYYCCFGTRSHVPERRLFLYRIITQAQSLRLPPENGSGRQSCKVRHRCSSSGKNNSRGGGGLLSKGAGPMPQIPSSSILEARFQIGACGSRVPRGLLRRTSQDLDSPFLPRRMFFAPPKLLHSRCPALPCDSGK